MALPELVTAAVVNPWEVLVSPPVIGLLTLIVNGVFAVIMAFIKRDHREIKANLVEQTKTLVEQKATMDKLEVNTNSKIDQLIKVSGEAENAKGNLQGQADRQAEIDAKIVAAGQKK